MSPSFRRLAVSTMTCVGLASTAALAGVGIASPTADAADGLVVKADFNNDSYADVVVGVPGEDVGAVRDAGAVQIFYGGTRDVRTSSAQTFHQNTAGVSDAAETGDAFGSAVTIGDFNGDRISDLAVGVPTEDVGVVRDAGAVQVFLGSNGGLTPSRSQFLSQASRGSANPAETGDRFGSALAAGNVAGSAQADLVVGVPLEDIGRAADAGAVHVLRGSASGLTTAGNQVLTQDTGGAADVAEAGDRFGSALAVANLAGNGAADIAVGVPNENVGRISDAGAVHVLRGAPGGVTTAGNQLLHQDSRGAGDRSEAGDRFGSSVAAGDVSGSGVADLAVGIPFEDVGSVVDAGAVHVLRGSAAGVTTVGNQVLSQNTAGAADVAERSDRFGAAVAIGDVAGSSKPDLVVGVPLEDVGRVSDAGAIQVLRGATAGVTTASNQVLHQSSRGSNAAAEPNDRFGSSLALGNVVGTGTRDVIVGVPLENVGSASDGGTIQIFNGTTGNVTVSGDQVIQQGTGTNSAPEDGDRFGSAVAAG